MSAPITDRVARPVPERPVQQVKPSVDKRAEAAAVANQQARSAQDAKASASRNADKGRHVDRYA
jgi:hypothetical protein